VPKVREKLPGLEPLPGLEAGQARFRCFDGIVGLFKRVAQEQPLVIVLDDLHCADSSSFLLLEFMARQLEGTPLLLVGTYRDMAVARSHPLARTLGSLVRAPGFQRLQLKPLTHQEVEEFIAVSSEVSTPELCSSTRAHWREPAVSGRSGTVVGARRKGEGACFGCSDTGRG
jgi:predicted ATPase